MKKIAFFVEGHTEAAFVVEVFSSIAATNHISIRQRKISGGSKDGRNPITIQIIAEHLETAAIYELWVYNCGNDERVCTDTVGVTSYIVELYPNLVREKFDKIIGLRDLRGMQGTMVMTKAHLPKVELAANVVIRRCPFITTKIVIAVMEIETWFLAETNHFLNIDSVLTPTFVKSKVAQLGFDPYSDDLTLRTEPAEDLDTLYKLAGTHLAYKKKQHQRDRVINALDYKNLYTTTQFRPDMEKLKALLEAIDAVI